jgi:hypothetical protein
MVIGRAGGITATSQNTRHVSLYQLKTRLHVYLCEQWMKNGSVKFH